MTNLKFNSTKEIKVSEKIVDQIIGQDEAVNIIKKVANQRRHVLLIGEPGTGKSMIGQALSELIPKEKLVDILALITPWWVRKEYGDILAAASLIGSMIFISAFAIFVNVGRRMSKNDKIQIPKLLIDTSQEKKAPFIEATGAHAGALLGDVLHDPLQSGGLGTPAFERLVPG